ncbi:MAG: DUF1150 domain-containing protein [Alphaproteobacteria bacterium]|jgi:hypothetical protein|nr:DUF1150 domain-containing protein [Alphaproteobacteria bacterium]MBU2042143.1 DUF1150 domain-containing protein [Alphaproteobacteria bacterium]MBU2126388.1 DUF1150 domain-containing protein [Alphaproteobacteria bacterium]MBU2209777.1 DUF1150 domain-containing protein [Alphaproteobacteria bacterium]MBU2292104.1 DUF1150 domain-containing protein [Alphaproteobacteria bacterium]
MTPTTIMTKEDFKGLGAPDLVYVREIRASDVMADVAVMVEPSLSIAPEAVLYAVHGADGERLAVMMDRETAFAAAVAHELEPVSVH